MPTKIGPFEIVSELAKSATAVVYKANDTQTNQIVALETIQLSAFGDQAAEVEKALLEEAATAKALSHANLAPVYGAAAADGQFYAAMEYIQGNSIATMLARKEGFSIWDMLDIGRQVCAGLDHAQSHNIYHYSLEPAKIMCGWDGTVRILGYGMSCVGQFASLLPGVPSILYYMSPEQIRGENLDARSNLFTLGAIFYEMVTDSKAFDGEVESVRQSIVEGIPVAPMLINPKLNPALSALIMKALAKDPAERYQSGRELLDDLEKCKETKPQAAKVQASPAKSVVVPEGLKAATQTKFAGASAPAPAAQKANAAAAGWPGAPAAQPKTSPPKVQAPKIQPPSRVAAPPAKPVTRAVAPPPPVMSAPVLDAPAADQQVDAQPLDAPQFDAASAEAPKIAVDPIMSGGPAPSKGVSFSEMTELPPLKEVSSLPDPPPPASEPEPEPAPAPNYSARQREPEKPKIQPRQVAQKAVKEIKSVPPQLMGYSIAAAAVLILAIAGYLYFHINGLNNDGDTPRPAAVSPAQSAPQPALQPAPAQPEQSAAQSAAAAAPDGQTGSPVADAQPEPVQAAPAKGRNARKKAHTAPVVATGVMTIDSMPQGAQVQVDGKSDPSWVTPLTLSGLGAGQHSVTVAKAGYSSDTRTVSVAAGSKAFVKTNLGQVTGTLAVSSNPAGANIYIDGKDSGKLTPARVSVDRGQHMILVRKPGYLDETTSAQFALGQTVNFSPPLRPLGNVDDIKTVGKMKKLFGKKEAQGMGVISVKTQPKGAQIAVNQHMLEKDSPVEFMLDPGNYVVDVTLSGYAPIHKVVTVEKGSKSVIDEVLKQE